MDNATEFTRVELIKKKESIKPLLLGSILSIISFLLFGWLGALTVCVICVFLSFPSHKVDCPKCHHNNLVLNHVHNFTCSKCRSLILIDWK
jgi:ribosomal protein S27AE